MIRKSRCRSHFRAVELDGGQDANMLETLALAYHANGKLEEAIEAQRRAIAQAQLGGPYNRADLEGKLMKYLVENGELVSAFAVSWDNFAMQLGRTLLSGEAHRRSADRASGRTKRPGPFLSKPRPCFAAAWRCGKRSCRTGTG